MKPKKRGFSLGGRAGVRARAFVGADKDHWFSERENELRQIAFHCGYVEGYRANNRSGNCRGKA